jgi:hypothetical protein
MAPGFQTDFVQELRKLFAELPAGVARLQVGRVPGHPEWPDPYFEVIPAKPLAAHFTGVAVSRDLDITIGEAQREFIGFARGGNLVRGASWQEELRWIWQAVITGGFTQRHYVDSSGKVIGWLAKFIVNGKEVVFRNGRRSEKLLGPAQVKIVSYEPYV